MVFLEALRNHPLRIRIGRLVRASAWEQRPSLVFGCGAFALVSALLLGGGTHGGFLSDAILELLAIPALLVALTSLVTLPRTQIKRPAESALIFCLAIVLLPLLQLIPLPPAIWTRLPHREEIVTIFDLLGRGLPWLPLSTGPNTTWLSLLSLLAPLAVFLCVIQLSYRERRMLSLVLIGVGIIGAFVGLLQVAQGASSPLRFFAVTNEGEAVGFFANRNHFAALLYVILLYGSAWATNVALTTDSWSDRRSLEASAILPVTASFLALVVVIAAETISRSRAGLGLMIVATFGAFALPLGTRHQQVGARTVKVIWVTMIVATLIIVQFALYRILDRFSTDPLADARPVFVHNTITAAMAYMPFGSGFGTFVPVYATFEQPHDMIQNVYANHAHNDVVEVWLEGGVAALILMVVFVAWLALRFKKLWWQPPADIRLIDILLARAATLAIALVMVHSLVDYPLRTDAMMAVVAFSCALLIEPVRGAQSAVATALNREKFSVRESAPSSKPPVVSASEAGSFLPRPQAQSHEPVSTTPPSPPGERWGEDIAWPEQWSNRQPGVDDEDRTK